MKFTVEEPKKSVVPDGLHKGVITKIEYRTEPHKYTDISIKLDDVDMELKAGFPSTISVKTILGQLLERMGLTLEVGKEIDTEEVLKGKRVQFQTLEKDGYSKILRDTIKPEKLDVGL